MNVAPFILHIIVSMSVILLGGNVMLSECCSHEQLGSFFQPPTGVIQTSTEQDPQVIVY